MLLQQALCRSSVLPKAEPGRAAGLTAPLQAGSWCPRGHGQLFPSPYTLRLAGCPVKGKPALATNDPSRPPLAAWAAGFTSLDTGRPGYQDGCLAQPQRRSKHPASS